MAYVLEVFEHVPRFRGDKGPAPKVGEIEVERAPAPGDEVVVAGKTWKVATLAGRQDHRHPCLTALRTRRESEGI